MTRSGWPLIRQLRGTRIMFKTDGDNIKQYFLPND